MFIVNILVIRWLANFYLSVESPEKLECSQIFYQIIKDKLKFLWPYQLRTIQYFGDPPAFVINLIFCQSLSTRLSRKGREVLGILRRFQSTLIFSSKLCKQAIFVTITA